MCSKYKSISQSRGTTKQLSAFTLPWGARGDIVRIKQLLVIVQLIGLVHSQTCGYLGAAVQVRLREDKEISENPSW